MRPRKKLVLEKKKDIKEEETEGKKGKLNKDGIRQLFSIYSYILPYKWVYFIGLIFLVLGTLTALAFPMLIGSLVNSSVETTDTMMGKIMPQIPPLTMPTLMKALIVVLILQGIFSYFRVLTFVYVSQKSMADIRKELFSKLITLPYPFFENNRVGALTSRITADVTQLEEMLSWTLAEFIRQILTLVGGSVLIAMISPKLSLIMLSTFPLIVICVMFFGRYIRKLSKRTQEELAETNIIAEESLHNIKVVKSFTNEFFERMRYNPGIDRVVEYGVKMGKYRGLLSTLIIYGIFGGIVFVLWNGISYVESGAMTIGELFTFILYTVYVGASVGGLGDIYGRLQKAVGATERIREIIGEKSEVKIEEHSMTESIEGNIDYNNVSFTYPTRTDVPILEDLSLQIKKGEKVALVGPSGSGKSTIAQLIMRFYDLEKGNILIDGKNINDYNITGLRKSIGIVPQEVILFGGSIKENILYGRPGATDKEIMDAAVQANAWEFIESFPEGLETLVGERGIKLSGGQKQRIAIARAILKNPAILILDEATSSLDSESEKLVQDALTKLMENRTSIIIAHRLSTIREVDRIYVIDNGKIVEEGSHQNLSILDKGVYKNLLELQNTFQGN